MPNVDNCSFKGVVKLHKLVTAIILLQVVIVIIFLIKGDLFFAMTIFACSLILIPRVRGKYYRRYSLCKAGIQLNEEIDELLDKGTPISIKYKQDLENRINYIKSELIKLTDER